MNEARDEGLLQFATARQAEYLKAYWETGSYQKAADRFGVHNRAVWGAIKAVKDKAARQGYAPDHDMTRTAPDGFLVKGVSTYYNKEGKPTGQWLKTAIDHQRQAELMQAAVKALCDEIKPEQPVPAPVRSLDSLLNCYVITDYHLGMKAWAEETGAHWDTEMAENLLVAWFGAAIAQSPDASVGVFAQLGDFLHFDGHEPKTPTHGHVLDASARFQEMARVAIRVIRRVVAMLLQKHQVVHVLLAEGNHDIYGSGWLREFFAVLYEHEPRVLVNTRADPYYCIEHGATSLFFHHGHKRKPEALETVLVAKFREVFGRTRHSYAHTGHLHHNRLLEGHTMTIEQHRTLAAPDAHASRGGWVSGRDAKVVTYHDQFGEVSRVTVSPAMLAAANDNRREARAA